MKLVLIFAWMSLVSRSMLAQVQEEELITVTQPEVSASFPGGFDSLKAFVQKNIEYPHAKPDKPEGRVFVEFVIKKDGSLSAIKVVKGLGDPYDKCVLDLFHIMPKWNPAKQRGKPVEVRMVYPVTFKF